MTTTDLLRRWDYINVLLMAERRGGTIRVSEVSKDGIPSHYRDAGPRHLSTSRVSRMLTRLVDAGLMKKEGRKFILTSRFKDMDARIRIDDRMADADFKRIEAGKHDDVIVIWGGSIKSGEKLAIAARHLRNAAYLIRDENLGVGLSQLQKTLNGIIENRRYSIREKAYAIFEAQIILMSEFEQMGRILKKEPKKKDEKRPKKKLVKNIEKKLEPNSVEFIERLLNSDGCSVIGRLGLRNRVRLHIDRIKTGDEQGLNPDRMMKIDKSISKSLERLRKRPAAVIMITMHFD